MSTSQCVKLCSQHDGLELLNCSSSCLQPGFCHRSVELAQQQRQHCLHREWQLVNISDHLPTYVAAIQHFNFISCKHSNLPSRLQCLADVFVLVFISFFTQLLLALLVCSSNFVLDSRSSHDSGLLYSASSTASSVFLNLTN